MRHLSLVALSLVGGGEGLALMRTLRKAREPPSLWVFDRRERLFDKLEAEVSHFWTGHGVSLKARLDFLKPRRRVVR